MKFMRYAFVVLLIISVVACSNSSTTSSTGTNGGDTTKSAMVANHNITDALALIPQEYIDAAYADLHIFYGHTSHGSQLVTGLELLDSTTHDRDALDIEEVSEDLGTGGDLSWADTTRTRLNQSGSDINVVMWSWCGGVSTNDAAGIDAYLNEMNELEGEYPNIQFVYMTGHTDGSGASGNLRTMNQRIRDYCTANNKILFDFADIESYDPDGNYYADASDGCDWCATWCASHTCGPYSVSCTDDSDCAHSHCFNCYQKGKAFWWLLARMAGWNGE